jgi:hypothetical protein
VEMLQVFWTLCLMQLHLKKCIVYDFIYKNTYIYYIVIKNIPYGLSRL